MQFVLARLRLRLVRGRERFDAGTLYFHRGDFQLQQFTVSMKELAEWFGFELARIVVDECLTH